MVEFEDGSTFTMNPKSLSAAPSKAKTGSKRKVAAAEDTAQPRAAAAASKKQKVAPAGMAAGHVAKTNSSEVFAKAESI